MQHRLNPEDLRLGMYICGFGGSWFGHPFWRAKFVLQNEDDLDRVQSSGVPYVVVDDSLGIGPEPAIETASLPALPLAPQIAPIRIRQAQPLPNRPLAGWEEAGKAREREDRQRAKLLVTRSMNVLRAAFADVRLGRAIRMDAVSSIVDDVVGTVERNPRTLLEILRLKQKNEYTYMHSIAVCTLMVNVARHMGKPETKVRDYGLAGLLHDLGKMGIPDTILNKEGRLTDDEFRTIREHPEQGYQVLAQSPNIPDMALDVCRYHHEKMDGTGYPFGLPAETLSLGVRLGAVCDVYDALTSERIYKEAWSPVEALSAMWSWEGHFDRALLFTFMQSIGIFVPGMLVQLRTNRLALVLEDKRRNSRPRVIAFYATRDRAFLTPEEVIIQDNLANDSIVAVARPEDWGLGDWDALAARLKDGESDLRATLPRTDKWPVSS